MSSKRSRKSTSGFIYIWYDRKRKRYYVGSHWGYPDDGYICSSNWMRDTYRKRPEDFKRRIIKFIYTSRKDLYEEETRYLQMIKDSEIRKKYYNLHRTANHWVASEKDKLNIRQKISASIQEKYDTDSEYAAKRKSHMSELGKQYGKETQFLPGQESWNKGKTGLQEGWCKGGENKKIQGENHWIVKKGGHSEESKEKNRQSHLGKKMPNTTGENHWTYGRPKTGKSAAQRQREYRERQKQKMLNDNVINICEYK